MSHHTSNIIEIESDTCFGLHVSEVHVGHRWQVHKDNRKLRHYSELLPFFKINFQIDFYITVNPRIMLLEFLLKGMKQRFPGQFKEEPNGR